MAVTWFGKAASFVMKGRDAGFSVGVSGFGCRGIFFFIFSRWDRSLPSHTMAKGEEAAVGYEVSIQEGK